MALLLLVGLGVGLFVGVGLGVGLRLGVGAQVRVEVVPPPVCVTLLLERVLCELYHRCLLNVPELVFRFQTQVDYNYKPTSLQALSSVA